jgi:Lrp/AsnC family transcriptional regulator for asnA, asnC and gidA
LQRDGRTPFTTLATELGVSEAHVRRRVRHLITNDVFAVTAVADPRALGLDSMAWIGLVVAPARAEKVALALADFPEVDYVVLTSGAFTVMAEVACRTTDDVYRLLVRLRALPGVQRTETFMYLRLLRQQFQWAAPDTDEPALNASAVRALNRPEVELDATDIALISELQRDGRASFRDIARRLNVSERSASASYTRLCQQGVVRLIAVGNPATLGFNAMAWLGVNLKDGGDLEETANALSDVPQVSYLVSAAGRYDLMAEVVCRDRTHLLETLTGAIGHAPGISNIDTFYYLRLLYRTTAGAWGAARTLAHNDRQGPEVAAEFAIPTISMRAAQ